MLANCAMMNVPPSELNGLSLHDYEAMLWHWNDAHSTDDVGSPDPEITMRLIDRINADPRMTGSAREAVN